MRFPPATLAAIGDGRVDLAFRRWQRPLAKAGGRQRTAIGVVGFDAVEPVARELLSEEDAQRAGFASRDELLAFLDWRTVGTIYRVRLRLAGPDPRVALRESLPDERDVVDIERRLGPARPHQPPRSVDSPRPRGDRGAAGRPRRRPRPAVRA
jgi:hypothetical protein